MFTSSWEITQSVFWQKRRSNIEGKNWNDILSFPSEMLTLVEIAACLRFLTQFSKQNILCRSSLGIYGGSTQILEISVLDLVIDL